MYDSFPLLSQVLSAGRDPGRVGNHFILSTDAQKLHILPNTESSLCLNHKQVTSLPSILNSMFTHC